MKTFSAIHLILLLFACGGKASEPTQTSASIPEAKPVAIVQANSCREMAFFQVGAEILAKNYDKNGIETSSQLTRVLEVNEADGFTVAKVEGINREARTNQETKVFYSYRCNGKAVFLDIASMYRTEAKNADDTFQSGEFEFPLEVKVGETLPEISSSMESEYGGKKMSMTFHITERKVEALEEVSTGAGTWQCYRISNELQVEMDIPGMDPKMKEMMVQMQSQNKMTAITWFAPELGVVKSESYKNGELESSNQLVSIKN